MGIYVRDMGTGERVVLVHGSLNADPGRVWRLQTELADRYRLLIPDRRGHGQSPPCEGRGFEAGVQDIIDLLGEGGHLVGLSLGAVLSMLAAARRPDLVRSLTLIEPPAFQVAPDHPAVAPLLERLIPVYTQSTTPEAFVMGFASAFGEAPGEVPHLEPAYRRAVEAAMIEGMPWTAELDLAALAALPAPKLLVSGNWHPAFEAVADRIASAIGAERFVLDGAGHGVQLAGQPFNERLIRLLQSA